MSPAVGSRVGLSVATGASAAALLLHRKRTTAIVRAADAHLAWAMRPDGYRVRLPGPPAGCSGGGSGSTARRRARPSSASTVTA
jgi:hypothetical protein